MQHIDLSRHTWYLSEQGSTQKQTATVPGCVHTDLLANASIPDPFWGTNELELQWIGERNWEYSTCFELGEELLAEEHLELVCDGLDTLATVFLNGKEILKSDNMFVAHRIDIGKHAKTGSNTLRIVFSSVEAYIRTARPEHNPRDINDPVGRCTTIRKEQCQFGWDWGPRLVTAGIWRPIRIEGWSRNRIEHLAIRQEHDTASAKVIVHICAKTAQPTKGQILRASISLRGHSVASLTAQNTLSIPVHKAELWWPAGQGEQPLYDLHVELIDTQSGEVISSKEQRIGLRTILLERKPDAWGESFQFVVNSRPVFAKGANWIPAHSFVAGLQRSDYERDLKAAVEANMNMIRVWGGGIYESEDFYDLCDELGLMVWQDFMFACTLYPHDDAFLQSVRAEATQQVRRLHHRASLALWCGNNELPQINKVDLRDPATRRGYEVLFHELLPQVVSREDGSTDYWPSSEWRGFFDSTHEDGEKRGDTHYWEVWHRRQPVTDYERWHFRFCSEFGMQSYSSIPTQDTFCPPDKANIFGPIMENHQKNKAGNQIISDYISRRYRFPKDQTALIYLSQLNQAFCMRFAIEHFRRISPRCMGALYWQLNDCWPVASWSSIEFTGRWKALHHAARRFFAPALLSAHILQDEENTIGNYRKKGDGRIDLYTVYDSPLPKAATVIWELRTLAPNGAAGKPGDIIESGTRKVRLRYGQSTRQKRLNLKKQIEQYGNDNLYLRIALQAGETILSEQTVFLSPPRFIELQKTDTKVKVKSLGKNRFSLTLSSAAFQHGLSIDIAGDIPALSDNFFDLYPQVEKTVELTTTKATSKEALRQNLRLYSLVDSYC